MFLQDVEAALLSSAPGDKLQQLQARCVVQLEELTALVRGPLSALERKVGGLQRHSKQHVLQLRLDMPIGSG